MSANWLKVTALLAYGPFVLTLGVYGVALALRGCGQPGLLRFLVEKTKEHTPVSRGPDGGPH